MSLSEVRGDVVCGVKGAWGDRGEEGLTGVNIFSHFFFELFKSKSSNVQESIFLCLLERERKKKFGK